MTHNEMAKGGGIKQTRPQETDSTYSKAIDKQVSGKPVGYRFTDKLAKKLGKKPGTKPTAAEIEKYKNRGVYFETRKNKSDINPKAKLEGGGDMEYAKGGTIASIVKKFKPKAIKHEGNSKDGYSVLIKDKNSDFQAWIDVYIDERHKDVITEWNKYIFHLDDENDVRDKAVMENDDVFQDSMSESINYLSDKGFIRNDDKANWHYTKRDGGDVEYAKGGQTSPQRESYSKRGDKEVKAKPVGYRFTEKLANRLGKNEYTKPTQEQIEKYSGKKNGIYFENRKDKSDINPRAKFELGGENPDEKLKVKVFVDVHENDYKEGEGEYVNSYRVDWLKNDIVKAKDLVKYLADNLYLSENPNDYVVFEDGRIDTDQLQDEDGSEASKHQIEMWKDGKMKLYNAHFIIKVEAVSNSRTPSVEELTSITNIGAYAKGGQTSPQRESYSKRGDKEVKAKPVGYRFTEKLANRLGKNEYTKPTQEQIEKYSGKKNGIYFENRKDKSDINPRAKFMHGGHNDEVLGNGRKLDRFTAVGIAEGFVEKQDWNDELKAWAYIQRHGLTRNLQGWFGRTAEQMIDRGLFDRKGNIDWEVANEIWDEDDEYAKGGQTAPQRESYSRRGDKEVTAKPVGYRFTNALAKRLGKKVTTRPSTEEVRKYLGKGIYFENRKDKSDVNPKAKLMGGGDTDYAKGGKIANQYTSIKRNKVWGRVDGVWNAWTPKQRGHFLSDHLDEFEEKGSFRFSDFGVGQVSNMNWETLFEKDDDLGLDIADVLRDHIEMGQYAKGGQTAPQETDSTYSKSIDKRVSGKPVGYRFTNKLANKLGKKPFTRPTAAEIEKYSGKGVYFETRKNKSDLNPKAKLEGGGESEYARGGGVPRTSNSDSKAYTENHLPFMANNLEGKTLENGDYVVLSYGYYPIWFWHKRTNKWYGNKDKFSVTTAKHISQSRPTYDAQMLSRGEMDNLMSKSIEGKDFKELGGTLESFEVAQP